MANPDWIRDEVILALDVYLEDKSTASNKHHPKVQELSSFLNSLAIFPSTVKDSKFRNPNGVSMKLSFFRQLDPEFKNKGLQSSGGKLEEDVWKDFAGDWDRLRLMSASPKFVCKEVEF